MRGKSKASPNIFERRSFCVQPVTARYRRLPCTEPLRSVICAKVKPSDNRL
jgi:hypothetical protein